MLTVLDAMTVKIHRVLADDSVERAWGRRALSGQHGARRIVWAWAGGRLQQPTRLGGFKTPDGKYAVTPAYSNQAVIEAHIGAEDQWTAEALWCRTLCATQLVLNTACMEGAYEWITETEPKAGHIYGDMAVVVQQFVWDLVIVRQLDELNTLQLAVQQSVLDLNL